MTKRRRALVLVDGEHYPPVLLDALAALRADNDVIAAVMLGGGEKLSGPIALGDLPIVESESQLEAVRRGLDEFTPDVVIDLSDQPVIDARGRNRLIALAGAYGVAYQAAGSFFEQPIVVSLHAGLLELRVFDRSKRFPGQAGDGRK